MARSYTIGTAARLTGVDGRRLRAWDGAGLIAPARSPSGYRVFTETDLADIARLRDEIARRGRFGAHLLRTDAQPLAPERRPAGWGPVMRAAAAALDRPWAAIVLRTAARGAHLAGAWGPAPVDDISADEEAWDAALLAARFAIPVGAFGAVPAEELTTLAVRGDDWRAVVLLPRAPRAVDSSARTLLEALVTSHQDHERDGVRLRRAAAELDAIGRLQEVIARERELSALLEGALDVLLALSGFAMGAVLLADRSGRRLLAAATRNVSPRYLYGIRNWRADEGIVGRAHTTRAPVAARDLLTDPRVTRAAVRAEGVRGFVGVPLLHRGRSLGVVELGSRVPRRIEPHEIAGLARCAGYLAAAVAAHGTEVRDARTADSAVPSGPLSPRQISVLQLLAEAYTTDEIAALLEISPKTIANSLTAAFRALGVSNRTQAVAEAIGRGWIAPVRPRAAS